MVRGGRKVVGIFSGGFISERQTAAGLGKLLALLFISMALPIAALIWHAFSQLKWESFHRVRILAEELSNQIDKDLARFIDEEQSRSPSDYTFLDPEITIEDLRVLHYVQPSPLSAFPMNNSVPGTLGYFQIDAAGRFSSPVLPPSYLYPAGAGLSPEEFSKRMRHVIRLQRILTVNQLLENRQNTGNSDKIIQGHSSYADMAQSASAPIAESSEDANALQRSPVQSGNPQSQIAFDRLTTSEEGRLAESDQTPQAENEESVSRLQLDSSYDLKSENFEASKKERTELAEESTTEAASPNKHYNQAMVSMKESLRRSIGQGTGPIEVSMLDSGHLILFRRVWNERERLIQGLLLEHQPFLDSEIAASYRNSRLSASGDLVVAFNGDILRQYSGNTSKHYQASVQQGIETLLYRRGLSAPLHGLELIYTVRQLPPAPGASVLSWVSLTVALVFIGGFYFLYKMGIRQIELASQQRNFVSAVSHELKTPLTSIRMYSEMLQSGWASDSKRQIYYRYIQNESERLSRLISNVLKLSNIQNNELNLDLQSVRVVDLMESLESRITTQFQQKEYQLIFETEEMIGEQRVSIDEDSFIQVIINLVDNAIKFSSSAEQRVVEIHCRQSTGRRLQFSVRDYGPGVPKDQLKNIFKLFYRPENELTRETVGTGIGLSIVSQLVNLMQGSVDVVNRDPGAEFRIILPLDSDCG